MAGAGASARQAARSSYSARLAAQRTQRVEAERWLTQPRTALASATRDKAVARGYVGWAGTHVALAAGRRDEAIALALEARDSLLSHGQNFIYIVGDLERVKQ